MAANPGAAAPAATAAPAVPHPLPGPNIGNLLESNDYNHDGMPRNIYGVSELALRTIVRDIKLGLLRAMSADVIQNNLPNTREDFLNIISNKLDTVYNQMLNLDNINHQLQQIPSINDFINPNIADLQRNEIRNRNLLNNPVDMSRLPNGNITTRELHSLLARPPDNDEQQYNPQTPSEANRIQASLNSIPIMESLYLRKHQELRQMFDFATLLYNKFNYTLRLSLHVVSLLSEYNARDNPRQTTFNIPKPVIIDIRRLITEQQSMQTAINSARDAVNNIDVERLGREFTDTEQQPPPPQQQQQQPQQTEPQTEQESDIDD